MEPLAAIAVIVCAAVAPAAARGRYGHEHYWGFGRGLVGAVMGLVALPLVIASAVVSGVDEEEPPYRSEPYRGDPYRDDGYAPQAGYAPPPVYYAPRPAYYPAPQVYYAPNPNYHYRAHVLSGAGRVSRTQFVLPWTLRISAGVRRVRVSTSITNLARTTIKA